MAAGKRKSEKAIDYDLKDCLKCDEEFKSTNRFIRICEECKELPEWSCGLFKKKTKLGEW